MLDISLMDWIELIGLFSLPVFLLLDLIWRDRQYKAPSFWRGRAAVVTFLNLQIAGFVAVFWSGVFGESHLLPGHLLGVWGGAITGILLYQLLHYWYHRIAHASDFVWRIAHQMHHSAESIDAFGAYYLHPLDNAIFTSIASVVFFPLLGLSLESAMIANVFLAANAVFQHANIKTPHWLGYIVQRPESHRIHHGRDIHRYNYCDLPLWDIVFGTFRNPVDGGPELAGFADGASSRIPAMLIGMDVMNAGDTSSGQEPAAA